MLEFELEDSHGFLCVLSLHVKFQCSRVYQSKHTHAHYKHNLPTCESPSFSVNNTFDTVKKERKKERKY